MKKVTIKFALVLALVLGLLTTATSTLLADPGDGGIDPDSVKKIELSFDPGDGGIDGDGIIAPSFYDPGDGGIDG